MVRASDAGALAAAGEGRGGCACGDGAAAAPAAAPAAAAARAAAAAHYRGGLGDLPPGWDWDVDDLDGAQFYIRPDGETTWADPRESFEDFERECAAAAARGVDVGAYFAEGAAGAGAPLGAGAAPGAPVDAAPRGGAGAPPPPPNAARAGQPPARRAPRYSL